MPAPTLYELLGVPADAAAAAIRRAYRDAARRLHPDTNPDPDAGPRFAAIAGAYATLADPAARRAYDRSLAPADTPSTSRPHFTWSNIAGAAREGADLPLADFDEMYEAYFGGPR